MKYIFKEGDRVQVNRTVSFAERAFIGLTGTITSASTHTQLLRVVLDTYNYQPAGNPYSLFYYDEVDLLSGLDIMLGLLG